MQHPDSLLLPLAKYLNGMSPSTERVGGKASRLAWLLRHGFDIPPTWVVDARPFRDLVRLRLPAVHDPRSLLRLVGDPSSLARMGDARESVLTEPLSPQLTDELRALWDSVETNAPWGLAVRSSATCEDAELTAMAGLATSVLGVRGPEQLADAVRRVWASALLPRALGHLASRGIDDIAMAVVIQVVIRADSSGVMFTRPPPSVDERVWAPDERLVNATLGLGAPIVNGAVAPDMLRFSAGEGTLRASTIATKKKALVVDGHGTAFVDVPEDQANLPAVSPKALERLASIADSLEHVDDVPHDVEFAIERDRVYVVQARPVVGNGFPEGGDARTVWSRANLSEALPGVATPLTWSIARNFSERGFRQAFHSLGCTVPADARLVANVHGRFYLNLSRFMRIAAQVPGLDPSTLVPLGGGDGVSQLEQQMEPVSRKAFYARLPWTAARLVREQAGLRRRVARYSRHATERHRIRRNGRLSILSNVQLAHTLTGLETDLDETGSLMLASASASLAGYLALSKSLAWVCQREDSERLTHALTAGVRDLESAKPGIAIARIAKVARRDPSLLRELVDGKIKRIEDLPDGSVRRELELFLDNYGDRAVREAELRTPRWREDPAPVLAMLAGALQTPESDAELALARARAKATEEMDALASDLSPLTATAIRGLVAHARNTTRLREHMRAWVTRVLGAIRSLALEVDRRILKEFPDLEPGAAFFCASSELRTFLEKGDPSLRHVVRMRRAEVGRDEARPDPPVTFVGRLPPVVLPPVPGVELTGLPASAGVVEGRVRVLRSGRELAEIIEPGDILVARTTDVGLTPLFLLAAGVITELGGPLSHAALVAREYGVPAVVNVAGATVALRTGERVRIDGGRGTVQRLDPPVTH